MKIELSLPGDFRARDVLVYHGRDPLSLSERVKMSDSNSGQISKALEFRGRAVCLHLRFGSGQVQASMENCRPAELTQLVVHMLGLEQPVQEFEMACSDHPELGPWIRKNSGLRLPQAASPFEALAWAICGQQISVTAALTIRRRWLQQVALPHPSGLLCHPEPERVSRMTTEELRHCGYSRGKARALLNLSQVLVGGFNLGPDGHLADRLLGLYGIGPWTVHYALLRGFNQLDASPHGDAGVLRALRLLTGRSEISPAWAQAWLAEFRPYRALAVAHLWASLPESQP